MRALLKMLALLAVLLMPFGMAPAAAAARQSQPASMPMQHCPEQGSSHGSKGGFAECTMACAAALPAADIRAGKPLLIITVSIAPGTQHALHGLHPDTATPPPKTS